jgi:RNA polymerase sigma-70 factor (ECF subfamily)
LLQQAARGDATAVESLFDQHRRRLKEMIRMRLDPRLAKRIDPSDVVQETLADAFRRMPEYLRDRPLPFYPWLRQFALDRLAAEHRRHIRTQKRSVRLEDDRDVGLSNESAMRLASRFVSKGPTASSAALQSELRSRVREALMNLSTTHRELLLMRHVEQMSLREIAATENIPLGTVKSRISRALVQLQELLEDA